MTAIRSSNRTKAQWAEYIEPPRARLAPLMREIPHVSTADMVTASAVPGPNPFRDVIAVDECGAPIAEGITVPCENLW